jgi:arylsulfatase A-like enzyme
MRDAHTPGTRRPDVILLLTDQERAAPSYESPEVRAWRREHLACERWFTDHAVTFAQHRTATVACVPSRPTLLTGQYPDLHGVTQTDGFGKRPHDARMRWLREGEVPTVGNWFRAAGYDTHYDGKWHISHADLHTDDGRVLATNDGRGRVFPDAVRAYLDADPLAPFGFSGWVGPEPHQLPVMANSGLRRDPLIAARVVAWLEDRYARRAAGDPDALRPFLLVASFVNPHDICLFPTWAIRSPLARTDREPPTDAPPPTAHEDLRTKPDIQAAYRDTLLSGFGLGPATQALYRLRGTAYRRMYHRLHLEVNEPLERVRRAVVDGTTATDGDAVLVRTSDHGELLGAHGGLHQKWSTLYDEALRVPFQVARVGTRTTTARTVDAPTTHIDVVPTLLGAAGIAERELAPRLARDFTEVHPLPGRDLCPVLDGGLADGRRAVYLQTRDNILEGDTLASVAAQLVGLGANPPAALRIRVLPGVATNVEGVVASVPDAMALGGQGHLWKLVRTFDDPATWTEPGTRQLGASGFGGERYRDAPLEDQWELYDLTADPIEAGNRWDDPGAAAVREHLLLVLDQQRAACVPERNEPWPYARRRPPSRAVPWPADVIARALSRIN